LRAVDGARKEMVNLENVTEEELARYCDEFKKLHSRYAEELGNERQRAKYLSRPDRTLNSLRRRKGTPRSPIKKAPRY
jgi:hypothetical protein